MVKEPLNVLVWALLMQDFPESLVLTLAVLSILNLRLWTKRTLFIALLQTATNLVRRLPIAFGMHTAILLISLVLYTHALTGARLSRVFLAALLCFSLVIAAELLYLKPLLSVTGLNYEEAFANPFWRAAFALPYEVLLLALALVKDCCNRRRGVAA